MQGEEAKCTAVTESRGFTCVAGQEIRARELSMEKHGKLEVSFLANHAKGNVPLDRKLAEAKKDEEYEMQWCVRMKILNKIVEDYQLNMFVVLLRHVHRRTEG